MKLIKQSLFKKAVTLVSLAALLNMFWTQRGGAVVVGQRAERSTSTKDPASGRVINVINRDPDSAGASISEAHAQQLGSALASGEYALDQIAKTLTITNGVALTYAVDILQDGTTFLYGQSGEKLQVLPGLAWCLPLLVFVAIVVIIIIVVILYVVWKCSHLLNHTNAPPTDPGADPVTTIPPAEGGPAFAAMMSGHYPLFTMIDPEYSDITSRGYLDGQSNLITGGVAGKMNMAIVSTNAVSKTNSSVLMRSSDPTGPWQPMSLTTTGWISSKVVGKALEDSSLRAYVYADGKPICGLWRLWDQTTSNWVQDPSNVEWISLPRVAGASAQYFKVNITP